MKSPELAPTKVDSERLISNFLEAVVSVSAKTTLQAKIAESPAVVSKQAAPHAVEAVTTPAAAVHPAHDDDARSHSLYVDEAPEPAPKDSFALNGGVLAEFANNRRLRDFHKVTPEEISRLSQSSFLGNLACDDDVVFMLRQLRAARDEATGKSARSYNEITEYMRSVMNEKIATGTPITSRAGLRRVLTPLRAAAGFMLAGLADLSLWRHRLLLKTGLPALASVAASTRIPRFSEYQALWTAEIVLALIVGAIALGPFLSRVEGMRRLKVRPAFGANQG